MKAVDAGIWAGVIITLGILAWYLGWLIAGALGLVNL